MSEPTPEELEATRSCKIGQELIAKSAAHCLVVYTLPNGDWHWVTSNKSYAIGSLHRIATYIDEQDRKDAREHGE